MSYGYSSPIDSDALHLPAFPAAFWAAGFTGVCAAFDSDSDSAHVQAADVCSEHPVPATTATYSTSGFTGVCVADDSDSYVAYIQVADVRVTQHSVPIAAAAPSTSSVTGVCAAFDSVSAVTSVAALPALLSSGFALGGNHGHSILQRIVFSLPA